MITKVVTRDGVVVHDCDETNCEVSWDGYKIATGRAAAKRIKKLPPGKAKGKTYTLAEDLNVQAERL